MLVTEVLVVGDKVDNDDWGELMRLVGHGLCTGSVCTIIIVGGGSLC